MKFISFIKKPKLEKLYIPEEKLAELWLLVDSHNGSKSSIYHLWKFIGEIYPETKLPGGWTLNIESSINPYVQKDK